MEMDIPNNNNSIDSSSGEEDGDDDLRAAIASIVATSGFSNGGSTDVTKSPISTNPNEVQKPKNNPKILKYSQIMAQKILDGIVEKSIEIVRVPSPVANNDPEIDEGGVRLFRGAPVGIVFDHVDEIQRPTKRPRILPGEEINEKSKKFKQQIKSIAVEGTDILAAAKDACQKALARQEAKEAKAKEAAKIEEERIAELKKIRGERWLPSIAKEMQLNSKLKKSEVKK